MLVSVGLKRSLNNMLTNLFKSLWQHRREFASYFVIGISAFILDVGSLHILKEIFNLNQVAAVAINQPPIILFVFWLNKKWSFQTTGQTHHQLVRFIALSIGNYLVSIAWMWGLSHEWGINYQAARISNIILAVSWNFLLYKYWVYRE